MREGSERHSEGGQWEHSVSDVWRASNATTTPRVAASSTVASACTASPCVACTTLPPKQKHHTAPSSADPSRRLRDNHAVLRAADGPRPLGSAGWDVAYDGRCEGACACVRRLGYHGATAACSLAATETETEAAGGLPSRAQR